MSAAAWFAFALLVQGLALQLIDAGTQLRYQHYRLRLSSLAQDWWIWLLLSAQLIGLIVVGWRRVLRGQRLVREAGGRVVLALALLWLTSAIIARPVWKYPLELTIATSIQLLALVAVAFGVAAVPRLGSRVAALGKALAGADATTPVRADRRFVLLLAGLVTMATAALSVLVYQRHPHIPDEVAYILQARYFATGALWQPLPPVPRAFDLDLIAYESARWYSLFPPGWPAVLSVGVLAGAPWLVNPVLSGLNVWLSWALLSRLYTQPVARFATILLCVSPWHLFMGMSYMAHTSSLTFALLSALAVAHAHRTGRLRWLALGGAGAAVVGLNRPLEGLIVGLVMGLPSLFVDRARFVRASLAFGGAFGAVSALVLPYNALLTGNPLRFPVVDYFDRYYWPNANAMGFGPDRGLGWPIDPRPGHSPLEAVVNASVNASQVNTELLGWACGSLIGVVALLVLRRLKTADWLMLGSTGIVVALHGFYWYTGGPDLGARYWFLSLVPLLALTARGAQELERLLARHAVASAGRVVFAAGVFASMALLTFVPWRSINKYYHFRDMRPDVRALAGDGRFDGSLVLVRGQRFPDYSSAAVYNVLEPGATADPIYVWDRNEDTRQAVLRAFPGRPVWVLDGPSLTGRSFEIADSPPSTAVTPPAVP